MVRAKPGSLFPPGFSLRAGPISTRTPEATREFNLFELPPFLRTLLVTDGTVTRALEAYYWESVNVRITSQAVVFVDPFGTGQTEQMLEREVVLENLSRGHVYACAKSTVATEQLLPDLRTALLTGSIGVGALLREKRLETFREIRSLVTRTADEYSPALGVAADAMVVARTYWIHTGHRPIAEICEVFPVDAYGV